MNVKIQNNPRFGPHSAEISFSHRPSEQVLQKLKDDGWRWSGRTCCWWKNAAGALQFAEAIKSDLSAEIPVKMPPPITPIEVPPDVLPAPLPCQSSGDPTVSDIAAMLHMALESMSRPSAM